MPARRTPNSSSANAYNTPPSSQPTDNYSSLRSTKNKRSPQRNGASDSDGVGGSSNSPKYTAYLRERSYDDLNDNPFAREEAFLRAMSESSIWASALAPRSSDNSVYSDDGNDINPFISNVNGDNTIGSRGINSPSGTSPSTGSSWSNPFKTLINILLGSLAFLLNIIGSTFFYIYWGIRESLNFILRNLTGNANGPFIETIAGVDRSAPPISPIPIVTATTAVSRNSKLFWPLLILLAALLTLFTLSLFESPLIDEYLPQFRSPIKIQLWPVNNTTYRIETAGESGSDIAKGGKKDDGILFTMDDLKKLIAAEVRNSCTGNGANAPSIGSSSDSLRGLISTEVKSICSHEIKKELSAHRSETPRLMNRKFTKENMLEIIRDEARKIVSKELLVFSQDKLNLPDFALHSGGAKVMSTLTSKTYEVWPDIWYKKVFARVSGQGILRGKPPVTAISPDTHVGQCWPFPGQRGQLAVLLNRRVYVNAVTYDHVSKDVAVEVMSAPKDFEVWGIVDEGANGKGKPTANNELEEGDDGLFLESTEEECGVREDGQYVSDRENNAHGSQNANSKALSDLDPSLENITSGDELKLGSSPLHIFLGAFTYDINGVPVQTFDVPSDILKHNKPIRAIIMKVKSNWGEPSYTCLYRFRVHGEPATNRIINDTEKEL
ncbi:692_t:CDS:1 [Acaulospora morrowiae]|uniref:692_t:CDS:1 n=1 Tax=Acaulospora morrowiae TaxID=94023 RepID=A0A9N8VW50_9GLOM|nr:692_t:CDS:1 [Acaulospora morrowiae]